MSKVSAFNFRIRGKIKPYVRMTQRGKYVKKNAQEYLASKDAMGWQFAEQLGENDMLPGRTRLSVDIMFHPARHTCDIDNLCKAVLDAMQGVVFPDDRWVDRLTVQRGNWRGRAKNDDIALVSVGVM